MFIKKSATHLVLVLFLSVLGANVIGEALRLILHFIVGGGSIVERALLNYVTWSLGPHMLNLIILSFEFELAMHFNVISLLGIFVGWYYYKYSY